MRRWRWPLNKIRPAFVRVATQLVTYRTARSEPKRLPQTAPRRFTYLGHKSIQHTVRYTELAPTRFESLFRD